MNRYAACTFGQAEIYDGIFTEMHSQCRRRKTASIRTLLKPVFGSVKKLGSGRFSQAVALGGTGLVFKTNFGSKHFGDDGQGHWLTFCADNQHLPWVPQLYYFQYDQRSGLYIVVMERLKHFGRSYRSAEYPLLDFTLGALESSRHYPEWNIEMYHDFRKVSSSAKVRRNIGRMPRMQGIVTFVKLYGEKAGKLISEHMYDVGDDRFDLDLHDGNVMHRPNGEFVVTDPYFAEYL